MEPVVGIEVPPIAHGRLGIDRHHLDLAEVIEPGVAEQAADAGIFVPAEIKRAAIDADIVVAGKSCPT